MTNAVLTVKGHKLTIEVDLSEEHGKSASGKSTIIATTAGNVDVPEHPGIKLGLNIYKR